MKSMPLQEYLSDPCPEPSFDSGTAWAMISRSPLHAKHGHPRLTPRLVEEESNVLDIGKAAHALFLEQDDSRFVLVEADDWRTKAAREQRAEAHANGLTPLLTHQWGAVLQIAEASRAALAACKELDGLFDGATVEHCCLWQEEGVWCRCRPDLVSSDYAINFQYKTTGANADPEAFGGGMLVRSGYHVQAYHHARGIESETGVRPKTIWLVQETEPPYAASILGMSPSLEQLAESQWKHALDLWRECLRTNQWPGYPSRVCWIEAKSWDVERWACREPAQPLERCPVGDCPRYICRCPECTKARDAA